ncbi:MAG: hypothetical protein CR982_03340 [Candidatus Cloacimonadota bacterium]|nr:MAG: hypothetical protein CR982_03340 [Candidatus Cloacimonadota bacterium]PIE78818.1 MAG: hypothetical protein CSA15_05795 [Candidatus Delongbacteria bacterium]
MEVKEVLLNPIFTHHIYEYEKGLRNLILFTSVIDDLPKLVKKLEERSIDYHVQHVNKRKINLFFGSSNSIKVIKSIDKERLIDYSPEEDFILGIMLGYDRDQQCKRYLERVGGEV